MTGLMLLGLVVTPVVWANAGPVWGLVAAFFLMGGLGWKLLAGFIGAMGPNRKEKMEFADAWEARAGKMVFGRRDTYPPPGLYQGWMRDREATGESAGAWMDRIIWPTTHSIPTPSSLWTPPASRATRHVLPPAPRSGVSLPMFEAIDPVTAATVPTEAGLRFGELIIPWSEIERLVWREEDAIFHTRSGVGMSIFGVRVSGVERDAWERYVAEVAPTAEVLD